MSTRQRDFSEGERPLAILVDDHRDSLEMYAMGLQSMGIESLIADTPQQALTLAATRQPDVIVADVMLSDESGLELAMRLRADARTRETPIIVLTGHADEATKHLARAAGCDRFLVKPCSPAALAAEIRDLLAPGERRL
jgi:two-component system phosphate regulon response regulator PhoB